MKYPEDATNDDLSLRAPDGQTADKRVYVPGQEVRFSGRDGDDIDRTVEAL